MYPVELGLSWGHVGCDGCLWCGQTSSYAGTADYLDGGGDVEGWDAQSPGVHLATPVIRGQGTSALHTY
jgi:hypothetical protein